MPTLMIRNLPDELYQQIKASASQHHRSMTQEAIVGLKHAFADAPGPAVDNLDDTVRWLQQKVWPQLNDDPRSIDQLIGYDRDGLPD